MSESDTSPTGDTSPTEETSISDDVASTTDASGSSIEVSVLFFGPLRELVGESRMEVTLAVPATGADLLNVIEDRHPEIRDHRRSVRLAVNQEYVPMMETLAGGDEVALITPVSGG